MKNMKRGKQTRPPLRKIHTSAAGLDVGSTFHVVAVGPERAKEPPCVRIVVASFERPSRASERGENEGRRAIYEWV